MVHRSDALDNDTFWESTFRPESSDSQTLWSQDPLLVLKNIEDFPKDLFLWVIFTDRYLLY